MNKDATTNSESASRLIDARIKELGDDGVAGAEAGGPGCGFISV